MRLDDYYDPAVESLFFRLQAAVAANDMKSAQGILGESSQELKTQFLVCAAASGAVDVAAFLCGTGLDPNRWDIHGLSPLDVACHEGHLEMATFLLDAGASIRPRWPLIRRITPIQYAAYQGRREVVRLLLDHGADPNDVCGRGEASLLRIDGQILRMLRDAGGRMPVEALQMLDRHEALGDDSRE